MPTVENILAMIRELSKHEQSLLRSKMDEPEFSIPTYPRGEGFISGEGPGWRNYRFIKAGEYRAPKKGEWYLSGAIPCAYYAHNDLRSNYHILRRQ